MELPLTDLYAIETGDDGVVRGVRVRVQAANRIAVWTGRVDASLVGTGVSGSDGFELRERSVVHFITWEQAHAYYLGSPYAGLVDSLRQRVLRLSLVPRSDATEG